MLCSLSQQVRHWLVPSETVAVQPGAERYSSSGVQYMELGSVFPGWPPGLLSEHTDACNQ